MNNKNTCHEKDSRNVQCSWDAVRHARVFADADQSLQELEKRADESCQAPSVSGAIEEPKQSKAY
jgi:hypothetical protein